LKEIAGVGRGRRFSVALFYQNLSQGYDQYGEHGFNAILGSITTKTFLPGCDDVTASYAARLVGQTTVWGHSFDDAPGTQYDKTRTTEAARPLIDPAEVRQLLKHKQAITITETMPPVRWTFPPSAKRLPRKLPPLFGYPRIITLPEAETLTAARELRDANAKRQSEVAQIEAKTSAPNENASSDAAAPQTATENNSITAKDSANNEQANSATKPTQDTKPDALATADGTPAAKAQTSLTLTRVVTGEQVVEAATERGLNQLTASVGARHDRTEKYLNQPAS